MKEKNNSSSDEKQETSEITQTASQQERSQLSLEGGKAPLSIYTRRVIDISKIKDYLNEDSSHGICGGKNLGNTCFMNSSIACISNCTELTYYFLSGDYKKDINKNNKLGLGGNLAKSWGGLLQQYWVSKTRVGNPSEFKRTLGNKVAMFRGFGHELSSKKEDESDEECAKRFWESNLKRNDSIITDLFCGQYKSTIVCPECGNINITFDPFNTLTLPIANKNLDKNDDPFDYLDEIHLFYIPKYSIRKPVRIVIKNILKNLNLDEIFKIIGNKRDFIYKDKIQDLFYINVFESKLKNFIEDISEIEDHTEDFIFSFDVLDDLENIKIPIYYKGCQFPRIISGTMDITLEELRKKIYLNIRRHIYSPLVSIEEQNDKDILTQKIQNYLHNMTIKDEDIINDIEEEYNNIFNNDKNDENINKNMKSFIDDIPFKIYMKEKNTEKEIIIIDKNNFYDLSQELIDLLGIKSYKDTLGKNLSALSNYEIFIEFNGKSQYINSKEMNLNSCLVYKTDFKNIKKQNKKNNKSHSNQKITLDDCIKNFCKEEKLEEGNEWYCSKCKKHTLATKKMELFYLPKILIICFKRFLRESYRWKKNEEFIDFPINNLDMGVHMIGPDKSHSKYNLFAVSQHYGSTAFGHYTAVCKNFDKWYSYNDSSVHECSENDARSSAAYVLFYRRETD